MATTCIYCKADSSTSTGVSHVLPELLSRNELTMPLGAECDACNSYAGRKLEPNLAGYPNIAFAIQYLGAPGKRGKVRDEIGGIGRQRVDPHHVQVSLKVLGRLSIEEDGKHVLEGRVRPVQGFNFLRFRRALHHIGLNFVAAYSGPDVALESRYDAVRRYVKNPSPANESWSYIQVERNEFPHALAAGNVEYEDVELVGIHIFQMSFYVDLLNTGRLAEAAAGVGGIFIEADRAEPPPVIFRAGGRFKPEL